MFQTHDAHPAPLTATARPTDMEGVGALAEALAGACPGVQATGSYAVYSDRSGGLSVLDAAEGGALQVG